MIRAIAHAKFNWALGLTGRTERGYHLLDMLNQSLALADELTLEEADELTLTADGISAGEDNLVLRAARLLLSETGVQRGARITLLKRIPSLAGLGGGSADCAAALLALNALWKLGLSERDLLALGLRLGADVPFCLTGGTMRVQGLGEILTPVAPFSHPLLLVKGRSSLSTAQVFAQSDELPAQEAIDVPAVHRALCRGDFRPFARTQNHLARPAALLEPEVGQLLSALRDRGASAALMTGSGSAVGAVFPTHEALADAHAFFRARYPFCEITQPWSRGVDLVYIGK